MFGFRGGETAGVVVRKRLYMKDAQQHWTFLTNFDASTIKNRLQLISIVKDRTGRSRAEAQADVDAWAGRQAILIEFGMMEVLDRDLGLGVWENEGGTDAFVDPAPLPPGVPSSGGCEGVPGFLNDIGSPEVEIGVRAFNCIGATPPADHPHVYLNFGSGSSILCPYCGTIFRFDARLRDDETRPSGCLHGAGQPWPGAEQSA